MASYVVMEPPAGAADRNRDEAQFIRDGFAFVAFFIPVVWLLWHRLWVEAALVLVATVGFAVLGQVTGFIGPPLLSLLFSLFFGLEGSALRMMALERRGWRHAGVVEADSSEDAETRYFFGAEDERPEDPAWPAVQPGLQSARRDPAPAAGLLFNPVRS